MVRQGAKWWCALIRVSLGGGPWLPPAFARRSFRIGHAMLTTSWDRMRSV